LFETPQILSAPATLPPGIRIYAIGDIHGRADFLRIMLEKVDADRRQRLVDRPILLFIGDYVDRGPSSKEVLDILLEYRGSSESMFLKGNHETFISRFLGDPAVLYEWRLCGGLETCCLTA
jgi:serine/threonine protein phosphatase 1